MPFLAAASLLVASREAPNVIQPGADLYPPDAAAARLEGDVPVHLQIGVDGGLRCTAQSPDRLALLKRPSCELIARRDIFPPAFDRAGKAVATTLDLVIRWRLKTNNAQFGGAVPIGRDYWIRHPDFPAIYRGTYISGLVRVAFDVTATGRVEHCGVERPSRDAAFDEATCPLLVRRATLLPALDAQGVPQATRGWFTVNWRGVPLDEDYSMEATPGDDACLAMHGGAGRPPRRSTGDQAGCLMGRSAR